MMTHRVITAREQYEMLSPWRTASEFDPTEVTQKLRGEFYDWHDQQPEDSNFLDSFSNRGGVDPNNPLGHWPTIENFLKDKYPEAHRGFLNGQEDAGEFMDDPDQATPLSRYDPDEDGSYWPEPYSSEGHQELGYDPKEVAAGMLLLHNRAHSGRGDSYMDTDKARLVDIFNKRQQMQRDYERRTTGRRVAMPWRTEHPDYQPADVAHNYNPDMGGAQSGGDHKNYLVGPKNNVWWHGSASGDIGGGNANFGLHIGDYQTAADNLASRIGKNPHHPEGRWDGTTSLVEAKTGKFDENGNQIRDSSGYYSFTHSDGTPMHGSLRPNVFPVRIVGPMGNTTDTAASDGQAHALIRRQHTRPPKTPKGYYYINAAEGSGISPETGIVSAVSAALPSVSHVEKLDPAKYEHIAQEAHHNWHKNENDPDRSSYDMSKVDGMSQMDRHHELRRQQQEQESGALEWRNRRRRGR